MHTSDRKVMLSNESRKETFVLLSQDCVKELGVSHPSHLSWRVSVTPLFSLSIPQVPAFLRR